MTSRSWFPSSSVLNKSLNMNYPYLRDPLSSYQGDSVATDEQESNSQLSECRRNSFSCPGLHECRRANAVKLILGWREGEKNVSLCSSWYQDIINERE
jgi:hypothetical protein